MGTTGLQGVTDLAEDLKRWLTLDAEGRVNVRVVAGSADSEHSREFFIVEATVAVLILGTENSVELEILEGASKRFEGLAEFCGLDCSQTVTVEVLEDFLNSPSFVFSTVGALAHLLEDAVLELGEAGWGHSALIGIETPGLDEHVNEVVLTLVGDNGVDFRVVLDKGVSGDVTIAGLGSKKGHEVRENRFGLLLAGGDTGVLGGVVLGNEALESARISTTGHLGPGVLDHLESVGGHVALDKKTAVVSHIFKHCCDLIEQCADSYIIK